MLACTDTLAAKLKTSHQRLPMRRQSWKDYSGIRTATPPLRASQAARGNCLPDSPAPSDNTEFRP
jgi:hypothetical protein